MTQVTHLLVYLTDVIKYTLILIQLTLELLASSTQLATKEQAHTTQVCSTVLTFLYKWLERLILAPDPPTDLDFAQSNTSCAAGTTDVQLTPTSNAAINRYEIISPAYVDNGTNDTFTGLMTSQAYIFQITDVTDVHIPKVLDRLK